MTKSYKGEVYLDRFGNEYTTDEISISRLSANQSSAASNCSGGRFNLLYVGSFTPNEQSTICSVFQYLTTQLGLPATGFQIPIQVEKAPAATIGGLGAGTAFYNQECGIIKSNAWEMLRLNANLSPFTFAGRLLISDVPNTGFTWNTLADDPISNSEFDLYTVALHEALHILGFASLIGLDGSSGIGGGTYSNWDRFLSTGSAANDFLIRPASGNCCDAHNFNATRYPGMPTPLGGAGCVSNVGFFNNVGAASPIAQVNDASSVPTSTNAMLNKLSHLDRSCNPGLNPVMHPGIAAGELRRTITSQELQILCALGYNTVSGCAQNCVVMANDDAATVFRTGNGANNPLTIPFSTILQNDVAPPGTIVSLVSGCGTGIGTAVHYPQNKNRGSG